MTLIEPEPVDRWSHLRPARPLPFALTVGQQAKLIQGACLLAGLCVEESTGIAPARLIVADGELVATAAWSMPFTLAANESRFDPPFTHGIIFERGIVVSPTVGNVDGVVFVVLLTADELHALTRSRDSFGR